jgi:uncharacterized protein (TIGR02266 family)
MDQRRHRRIPYEVTVDLTSELGTQVVRVCDISEGGVFIDTSDPLSIGTACQLEIDLGFRIISVNAEVAWHKPGHGGFTGMGMRFAYASEAARSALRNFIALQVYDDEPWETRTPRASRHSMWA